MSDNTHKIALPLISRNDESSRLPLVVNLVCKYWGIDIPISGHPPATAGASMIDGIELAEAHGLECFSYRGSIKDLKKRIDQSIPPIVILPGLRDNSQHANVVSGYDPSERRILLYVPEPDTIGAVPESRFEQGWKQDDMMAIVLVPSDMVSLLQKDALESRNSNRVYLECERLWRNGKAQEAARRLEHAVKDDPTNAQAWGMLGSIYNEQGSPEALRCYGEALRVNPEYYLAHRGKGNYFLKTMRYPEAVSCYIDAIRINPGRSPGVYKNRGIAFMQLNENEKAKADFQEYLKLAPDARDADSILQAIAELR